MSRAIKMISLLGVTCFAFTAGSCNSSSPAPETVGPPARQEASPPESPSAPASPSWVAKYTAACPGVAPEKCPGIYGFTVNSEGYYKVGPAPTGEFISGKIDKTELAAMNTSLAEAVTASVTAHDTPSTDHLEISSGSHSLESNAPAAIAQAKALASKYYPSEFPNPCVASAFALEKSYSELTSCETAADCAYVDDSYLPAVSGAAVPLDDCTYLAPLVVANGFELVTNQLKLLMKREVVRQICGTGLKRPFCAQPAQLNSTAASPLCVGGTCRISP